MLRLIGSTRGPRVSPLTKLLVVTDRSLLVAQYRELAAIPSLVQLIPGHGRNIEDQAPAVLLDVASRI